MKSLLKYLPWEIVICPLSLAVCFAVGIMVFGQLYILTGITFFFLAAAIVLMLGKAYKVQPQLAQGFTAIYFGMEHRHSICFCSDCEAFHR